MSVLLRLVLIASYLPYVKLPSIVPNRGCGLVCQCHDHSCFAHQLLHASSGTANISIIEEKAAAIT
jgi:hypothetical protein